MKSLINKTALITGASQRIGAAIARLLHQEGMNLLLHYRGSKLAAEQLAAQLYAKRPGSVAIAQADLVDMAAISRLIEQTESNFGRLDVLVNNASSFFPTPMGQVTLANWEDLMVSNLRGPFFLSQVAAPLLQKSKGSIINLVDIHGERPRKGYPVYSIAKAGNAMMVRALAQELAPDVRVNGVAPGAILWPGEPLSEEKQQRILERTLLRRAGTEEDIAKAVLYLVRDADYVTGQIVNVDGGRTVQQ